MKKVNDILRDVKVILDENEKINNGFLTIEGGSDEMKDPDQLQTDDLILTLIPIAIDKVHKLASEDMLQDVVITAGDGSGNGGSEEEGAFAADWKDYDKYCTSTKLPEGFLKVSYVRLRGWRRGAVSVVEEIDPLYAEFFSDFAGVRPTTIYPAVAIVNGEGGLELVACPRMEKGSAGSAKSVLRYIAKSVQGEEEGEAAYNIAEKVYYAVIYCVAYLYYISINEKQRADMMAAECVELLGVEQNNLANA